MSNLERYGKLGTIAVLFLVVCTGCSRSGDVNSEAERQRRSSVQSRSFGSTKEGAPVTLYTLTNTSGMRATITNYGGIVVTLETPDRSGKLGDVVLGFDSMKSYVETHPYFGALIGRYGNRIANGRFSLGGNEYKLVTNNGQNSLHGGIRGFDKVVWVPKDIPDAEHPALELSYASADGEEGYPGNLQVTVRYTLTDANELKIDYLAKTDKQTVVNLTNHSYFNLAGQGSGDVLEHEVKINAETFTPVDAGLIPTGELRPVKGTPFDFTKPTSIGARINQADEQLKSGGGYDHNFVLNGPNGQNKLAAEVFEPKSGRVMQVYTTEPGLQFYTGNFLDGTNKGKGGKVYQKRSGFCMETQHFPDSPNKPQFPSTVLRPGEKYISQTTYRFSSR